MLTLRRRPRVLDLSAFRAAGHPGRLVNRSTFVGGTGAALAASYPEQDLVPLAGYDGEKDWSVDARPLFVLDGFPEPRTSDLPDVWRRLGDELRSARYRRAVSDVVGIDLTATPMEANIFRYGPGSWFGPHVDVPIKLATSVLYFNEEWDLSWGGCFRFLQSQDADDVAATVEPRVGNSVTFLRTDVSWHCVERVSTDSPHPRRALVVTFFAPGAPSATWGTPDEPFAYPRA